MTKFDKAVKSIMESVKLLKEGPEISMEFYEDFPQIPVKSIIPDDTTGGVFILHGEATAEYDVYGGGGDGWNTPYYDDEAEVQEITWDDMVLKRDNYSNEDKYAGKTYDYDTELITVKPEDIGQENYDKVIQILKTRAEDALVKKVERKGVQHAKDTWSP